MAVAPTFGTRRKHQRDLNDCMAKVKLANYPVAPSSKTIYFVRHAESKSNVAKGSIGKKPVRGTIALMTVGFNSDLSDAGRNQLLQVRPAAQRIDGIEAVFYSPLKRAEQTALTLFGEEHGKGDFKPASGQLWLPVRAMKEARPKEWAQSSCACSSSIMDARVAVFIRFVSMLPFSQIVLVGHSRFFQNMFKAMESPLMLRNANIWKTALAEGGEAGLVCLSKELVAQPPDQVQLTASGTASGTDDNQVEEEQTKEVPEPSLEGKEEAVPLERLPISPPASGKGKE